MAVSQPDRSRVTACVVSPLADSLNLTDFVAAHESAPGPFLPFAATQRYVWSWGTSRHFADIANMSLVTHFDVSRPPIAVLHNSPSLMW